MYNILNNNLTLKKISDNIIVVDNILNNAFVDFLRLRMQLSNKYNGN